MFMASNARIVTVIRPDASKGYTPGNRYGQSQHVVERGNANNDNEATQSTRHCYAKCISECINPSHSKEENFCANKCRDRCNT
ncbi:unnamed protein product [Sphenostylis stenocarpa]|uniref:Uncharacterized protein n=1 Tax=Sphenostylis stenocarpa TaxID=92480 RepID=A0AA86SFW4_9FABA|nr:unnamed protein product [Sphenostylis stenocarpa]